MNLKLSKYIFPSVISMLAVGANANVDGLFIGRVLGDSGLAAINIVWPIVAFITSLGTGITVGGSVIISKLRGKGNVEDAQALKKTIMILIALLALFFGFILSTFDYYLLKIMGAKGEVLQLANQYSSIISGGIIFTMFGAGMPVLLRNDGKTYISMLYSLIGFIIHFLLNIMLFKKFLMYGVAISWVVSQATVSILSIYSFKFNIKADFGLNKLILILKNSAAPFGINFVPSLVLLFTNYYAMRYGGVEAVSAYAATSYVIYTFDYIFQGICDGIQPPLSFYNGEGNLKAVNIVLKKAAYVLFICVIICVISTPVMKLYIPKLLYVSEIATNHIKAAFAIYIFSYPFKAFSKLICSYFYSVGKVVEANILAYLDPLILTPFFLVLLTNVYNIKGVWLAMSISQLALSAIALIIFLKKKNNT